MYQQDSTPVQSKNVLVIAKGSKQLTWTDKQTGQQKTAPLYQITGNDNVCYETGNADFANSVNVGQTVTVNFKVVTRPGKNGTMFTNYRLVVPSSPNAQTKMILDELEVLKSMLGGNKLNPTSAGLSAVNTPVSPNQNTVEDIDLPF